MMTNAIRKRNGEINFKRLSLCPRIWQLDVLSFLVWKICNTFEDPYYWYTPQQVVHIIALDAFWPPKSQLQRVSTRNDIKFMWCVNWILEVEIQSWFIRSSDLTINHVYLGIDVCRQRSLKIFFRAIWQRMSGLFGARNCLVAEKIEGQES